MDLNATGLLLVLFCSMAASVVPSHATNSSTDLPPAVRDSNGKEIIPGANYFVLNRFFIFGGLTIDNRGVDRCPLYVARAPFEIQRGLPMTFTPVNPDDEVVRVSTDLNVQISDVSTVWTLAPPDNSTGARYVAINGEKGNPGAETMSNWFKLERRTPAEGGSEEVFEYKFVFCPAVCETCRPECGDLGLLDDEGKLFLGLSDDPYYVTFGRTYQWLDDPRDHHEA